jgi:hypothetical protein
MEKKFNLQDFELFQKMAATGAVHAFNEHPDLSLINITKSYITISNTAVKQIGLKTDSRIITADKDGILYLVCLPFNSQLSGYKRLKDTRLSYPVYSINYKMKSKFNTGIYEIVDTIFVSGLDFYELKFFK